MFKYKYEEKGRDKEDHNEICNNNKCYSITYVYFDKTDAKTKARTDRKKTTT